MDGTDSNQDRRDLQEPAEEQFGELLRAAPEPPLGPEELERLAARFAARADREGLVDVAYAELDSPLGPLLGAMTDRGLVSLSFSTEPTEQVLAFLADRISPRVVELPRRFEEVRRELDEYFVGRRREFELPLDWRLSKGFVCDVLRQTNRIPYGETRTYTDMAELAGSPRAVRAAGSALGSNPIPIVVPCHRVLRKGGALGGYRGGLEVKRRLLALEGISG